MVPGFNINVTVTLTPATDRGAGFPDCLFMLDEPTFGLLVRIVAIASKNIVGSLRFAVGAFLPTATVPGVPRELG